jgi:hypothetical protein
MNVVAASGIADERAVRVGSRSSWESDDMAFWRTETRAELRFGKPSDADIAQVADERSHRTFTTTHASLLHDLRTARSAVWSDRALLACLEKLQTSQVSEAWCVAVEDAWAEGPDTLCVVYKAAHAGPSLVGLRRTRADALTSSATDQYVPGDFVDVGLYELGDPGDPDPTAFGQTIAEFDIGEPLGTVFDQLRADDDGTGWWGTLGSELPRHP